MNNGEERVGEGAGLRLAEPSGAEPKGEAAVWEGHVSERPWGVVPGRVNSGTAVFDNSF